MTAKTTATNLGRRSFIAMGAAATAGLAGAQSIAVKNRMRRKVPDPAGDVKPVSDAQFDAAVATLENTGIFDDEKRLPALRVVQRSIDRMAGTTEFLVGMKDVTPKARIDAIHAKFPVMRWYDRAFDRVFDEFTSAKVTGPVPAVWYLYNMGVLVKTATCAFGIDVCHRQAPRLAKHLDFLLATHNHGDHFNMRLVNAMCAAGKPVITNFHLCRDWYSRELEKTFTIGDVTIHTTAADHQTWLRLAVTCFEVVCGKGKDAFTIFHSGDCCRADHLKPRGRPDLYFGHCAIGLDILKAAQTTMPAKTFLPVHHQELGHLPGPYRCVAFEDEPLKTVRRLRDAGFRSVMPVWGDRIAI